MSLNRGIFYTTLTQIPIALLGAISGIFITRILGPSGKGVFAIFQSDVNLFILFLSFNINLGLNYFISNGKIQKGKIIGLSIYIFGLSTLFLLFILLLNQFIFKEGGFIFPKGFDSYFFYLFLFGSVLLGIANSIFSAIFQGLKKFRVVNQVTLINGILNLSVFGVYFLVNYRSAEPWELRLRNILLFTLLVSFLNTALWFVNYLLKVRVTPDFGIPKKVLVGVASFTSLAYLSNLINFLNYRLDVWVIETFRTVEELGYYSLAVNVSQIFWLLPASMATVMLPYMSSSKHEVMLKKFTLLSRINFTSLVLLIASAYALAGYVIPMVYGIDFTNSVLPLKILLPGIVLAGASKIFAIIAVSNNKIQYNLYAASIGLLFTVILDFSIIPVYGVVGASAVTSFVYLIIFISLFILLNRNLGLPFQNYFFLTSLDYKGFNFRNIFK
ncbi:MAG: polysaccharide biosynthesis C-terminal domain-containing protein [Cyclobacteriaceae bacterium]